VTTIPDSAPVSCPSLPAVAATPDREPQVDAALDPTQMLGGSPAQDDVHLLVPTRSRPVAVGASSGLALIPSGTEHRPNTGRRAIVRWPLGVVLTAQAALSLRLIWSNTAFQDEALYLRAGHLEWARWLHGTPVPDFPSYFSGAPVLYPPIAALADSFGGLAAARLLSAICMLAVTGVLWATTLRLYGQRAALVSAALFATLAGTQFIGALATFDALALLLLAIAVWLGVRAVDCDYPARFSLVMTAGVVLAAADAVKYVTALFTPVVIVVVAMAAWRRSGRGAGLSVGLALLGSWLALIVTAVAVGGHQYWLGFTASTLDRPQATIPATTVLQHSYIWTSLILVLAVLGSVLAVRGERRGKLLPIVLTATALLAPAMQARLHTTVSLQKHVVFGAWFAAIAAGYAMARLSRVDPGRGWAVVIALPIAASTLFGSMGQATALYQVWPNSAAAVSLLRSAVKAHPGKYLAEDYDVEAYYLRAEVPWQRWSNTYYFRYRGAPPGTTSYEAAIASHYFSLVILDFADTTAADRQISADMHRAGHYYVLARAGGYTIWALGEPMSAGSSRGIHARS
jgi:4-amino-4-deoxy-L-arabinose transferase-like glycosyltransferase